MRSLTNPSRPRLIARVSPVNPRFRCRDGSTYYRLDFGDDWGDRPATETITGYGGALPYVVQGAFPVGADAAIVNGDRILAVSSKYALGIDNKVLYRVIQSPANLTSATEITFTNAPRAGTSVGLASTSSGASLFFFRASDGKLCRKPYTHPSGWGADALYTNSPAFNPGAAVAPLSDSEGYVLDHSPSSGPRIFYFNGSTWSSGAVVGPRLPQQPANCHWFDAEIINGQRVLVYNINGVQYASLGWTDGMVSDPVPCYPLSPEFANFQLRIARVSVVGDRLVGVAWVRISGSRDPGASFYHLVYSWDGLQWSLPPYAAVGEEHARGKFLVLGSNAYIIGASLCYVGDTVSWMGGSPGADQAVYITEALTRADLNSAGEVNASMLLPDSYPVDTVEPGAMVQLSVKEDGGSTEHPLGIYYVDGLSFRKVANGTEARLLARGPLKHLIDHSFPTDATVDGPKVYRHDFSLGGPAPQVGTWRHDYEQRVSSFNGEPDNTGIATVGALVSGSFLLRVRLRITRQASGALVGLVLWGESFEPGQERYYRYVMGPGVSRLERVLGSQVTVVAYGSLGFTFSADTWYDIQALYRRNILEVWVRPEGSAWTNTLYCSAWTEDEPLGGAVGLYAFIPVSLLEADLEMDQVAAMQVKDAVYWPNSAAVVTNDEIISYNAKDGNTLKELGRGSLTPRRFHPKGSVVALHRQRLEVSRFDVFEIGPPLSVADGLRAMAAITGVRGRVRPLVQHSGGSSAVFPQLFGHSWVLRGNHTSLPLTVYLWCNNTNPPTSGYKLYLTTNLVQLINLADNTIVDQAPAAPYSPSSYTVLAYDQMVAVWTADQFCCAVFLPKDAARAGCVGISANASLFASELCEVLEASAWSIQDNVRGALQRLVEGRNVAMRERYDGTVEFTTLVAPDSLGTLDHSLVGADLYTEEDTDWASGLVLWGGEDWIVLRAQDADRLRWTQAQSPYIYSPQRLQAHGYLLLRRLWEGRRTREISMKADFRVEPGDQIELTPLRGLPAGLYLVFSVRLRYTKAGVFTELALKGWPQSFPPYTWPATVGSARYS